MARYAVCKKSELQEGQMIGALAGEEAVLIANVNGAYYAMNAECGHESGPLADGELKDNIVTCPWHSSRWDVKTGKLVWFARPLEALKTYKVTMEGDDVFVEV